MHEELPHHNALTCKQKNSGADKLSIFHKLFSQLCLRDTSSYRESHLVKTINKFGSIKDICKECLFTLLAQVRDQVLRSSHFKIYEY